jgi:hypothetical protein
MNDPKQAIKQVRLDLEEGTGESIYELRMPPGSVLEDVGRKLGMSEPEIQDALGSRE